MDKKSPALEKDGAFLFGDEMRKAVLQPWKWVLILSALFALRLAAGLCFPPVQPMEDEVHAALLGLKYYATGLWPYFGNEVFAPYPQTGFLTQDPGALQVLLIGLPWKLWPTPVASFVATNLMSMAGYCLLGFYACKRLPKLPAEFVLPWVLTLPWCLHYSTSVINISNSTPLACLFFVAFLESLPSLSLGLISPRWANAWMGFALSGWIQLHRTWVLILPLVLFSFFLQWKETRKFQAPVFFALGTLPLLALIVPTFFRPEFHFLGEASGFSFGLNIENLKNFFKVLAQFFALACFEMPRFIGISTSGRFQFLTQHWLLIPGVFLWYFGFLQLFFLVVSLFYRPSKLKDWNGIRLLMVFLFLFTFGCFLLTAKHPDVNHYAELLPMITLYSLYVWTRLWDRRWGRNLLWFALACSLVFQTALVFIRLPERSSFYLKYHEPLAQAIAQRNDHLLGERPAGAWY
jgi:hypothetical protein